MIPARRIRGIDRGDPIAFTFEDQAAQGFAGESVAGALLAQGKATTFVTPHGQSRGYFCGMGTCWECAVEIDGAVVRGCRTPIAQGLQVRRAPK